MEAEEASVEGRVCGGIYGRDLRRQRRAAVIERWQPCARPRTVSFSPGFLTVLRWRPENVEPGT